MTTLVFTHLLGWLILGLSKERARIRKNQKAWNARNPGKAKARSRRWHLENKEISLKRASEYYWSDPEKGRQNAQKYRKENPDKAAASCKNVYQKNRETYLKRQVEYCRKRRATDPLYRLVQSLRGRVWAAVQRSCKSAATLELLGCPIEQLRAHLENQFSPGMTWANYGKWHVDHRRPCASFDLTQPEQQKLCFHYSNLQPLWAIDNIRKGDKWPA